MINYIAYFTVKIINTNKEVSGDKIFVRSHESAEQECKDIVDWFNSTLRPGESPREFLRVDRIEQDVIENEDDFSDDDFSDDDFEDEDDDFFF